MAGSAAVAESSRDASLTSAPPAAPSPLCCGHGNRRWYLLVHLLSRFNETKWQQFGQMKKVPFCRDIGPFFMLVRLGCMIELLLMGVKGKH